MRRFTYLMPYFKDNGEWRAYALAAVTRELNGPAGHPVRRDWTEPRESGRMYEK